MSKFIGKRVIVRTENAGVHFGKLEEKYGSVVRLSNSRRLWYWSGASSLSQLAVDGVKRPNECKFPVAVPEIEVSGVIEIIPVSEKAASVIDAVQVWEQ